MVRQHAPPPRPVVVHVGAPQIQHVRNGFLAQHRGESLGFGRGLVGAAAADDHDAAVGLQPAQRLAAEALSGVREQMGRMQEMIQPLLTLVLGGILIGILVKRLGVPIPGWEGHIPTEPSMVDVISPETLREYQLS